MLNKTNWQEGVKMLGLYAAINRNSFSGQYELQFDLSLVSFWAAGGISWTSGL